MSLLSQFSGATRVATLLVKAPGANEGSLSILSGYAQCATAASGAMTAGVLKAALTLTGRGRMNWFAAWNATAVSRTIRVKVTLDGNVVYDKTTPGSATSGVGLLAIGAGNAAAGVSSSVAFQPLDYRVSCLIEVANSLSETDGITYGYNYEVHQ